MPVPHRHYHHEVCSVRCCDTLCLTCIHISFCQTDTCTILKCVLVTFHFSLQQLNNEEDPGVEKGLYVCLSSRIEAHSPNIPYLVIIEGSKNASLQSVRLSKALTRLQKKQMRYLPQTLIGTMLQCTLSLPSFLPNLGPPT